MTVSVRAEMAHLVEAAIAAVRPEALVPRRIECRGGELLLDQAPFAEAVRLAGRIVVIGGGKAAAGMAAAVEAVLVPAIAGGADVRGLVSEAAGARGGPGDQACGREPADARGGRCDGRDDRRSCGSGA
jgi:glycerate-2-kinase